MTGEPISTTLLVASAASTGAGLLSSRQQEKTELRALEAETERAKLEATDMAVVQAKTFRQALASQIALSSLRGAGGSLARQFGAQSMANFLQDQGILERRKQFIDTASLQKKADIKAGRFGRDISAIGGLISSGMGSLNLSSIYSKKNEAGGL